MARFLTNVMISKKPYFLEFDCFKAPLLIEEKEAWKKRHQYDQPMAPSGNFLFFVSKEDLPSFIDDKAVVNVRLNSNVPEQYRILRFLVHQALKILFESRGFSKWRAFYSKKDYMRTIEGRFGLLYNVFNGVKPRVFFENGYCMIAFEHSSMIFTRLPSAGNFEIFKGKLYLITICENCKESSTCENIQHEVSRFSRLEKPRVFIVDIEGKEFDCPISSVRIESTPMIMKGEYARVLHLTTPTTSEESQFLFELVNILSEGDFILDLGRNIDFSWLELEA